MSKKLKWNYNLNGSSYTGAVKQTLSAVNAEGNTVDLGVTLADTDREVEIEDPSEEVAITIKGEKLGAAATKSISYDPTITYNYSPDGRSGYFAKLSADGDFTNIVKGGTAFVVLNGIKYYKNTYGYESTSQITFANPLSVRNAVTVSINGGEEVQKDSEDGHLFRFENITEDTVIKFRFLYLAYNVSSTDDTLYNECYAELTVNVTVSEEEVTESALIVTMDDTKAIDVDVPTVFNYKLTYNGKQVVPSTIRITIATKVWGNNYDVTVDSKMFTANTITLNSNGIPSSIAIHFTYNGIEVIKYVSVKKNILELALLTAKTDYQDLAYGDFPVLKWQVKYGGAILEDAVNTHISFVDAITEEEQRSFYLSDYNTSKVFNKYLITSLPSLYSSDYIGGSGNEAGQGRELTVTTKREFNVSDYLLYDINHLYEDFKTNPKNLFFNITIAYRGQEASLADVHNYDYYSYIAYAWINIKYKITYKDLEKTLNAYFDAYPTKSLMISGEDTPYFNFKWHYMYAGSLADKYITSQKLTVRRYIDGVEIEDDEYPHVYDSTDLTGVNPFMFTEREQSIDFVEIGTYKITLEADSVNSNNETISTSIEQTVEVVEDDGGTFSIDLGTDYAENLSSNQVPRYTVVPVYTTADGVESRLSVDDPNILYCSYFTDYGNGVVRQTGDYYNLLTKSTAGSKIRFEANYHGKFASVEHTPTWK